MDDSIDSTPGRPVQAVQLTCDVINALKILDGGGVTEIARHIDRSKAAVHGHLATLHENELVVKNGNEYRLGLSFLELGERARRAIDPYPIVREEMQRMAEETGEVVQFMVEDHGRGVYVYRATGENAVETASYAGKREYLHCTALGKAILSCHAPAEIGSIIERHGLPAKTENTITSEDRLVEEIEQINEQGISFDDEEIVRGLRCIAAPIRSPSGQEYGAISFSGPKSRFKGDYYRGDLSEKILEAANTIEINASHKIGD